MQAHMVSIKAALARKNEYAIEYVANPFVPPPLAEKQTGEKAVCNERSDNPTNN